MNKIPLLGLVVMMAACGGGSPTRPTPTPTPVPAPAPAPAPVPLRATIALETWAYANCVQLDANGPLFCLVSVTVRNQGPDCAGAVRSTLHITTDAGIFVKDIQFDLPGDIVLRPNETYHLSSSQRQTLSQTENTRGRLEAFATPARCS